MNQHKIINIVFSLIFSIFIIAIIFFIYKYKMFIVISGSMQPTLKTNELVIIENIKDDIQYKVGDIITYYDSKENDNITHRIVEVTQNGYYTKGDSNNINDLNIVKRDQIIGKMIYHSFFLGNLYVQYKFILLALIILAFILMQCLFSLINKEKVNKKIGENKTNEAKY